jgi:hypothetical protein
MFAMKEYPHDVMPLYSQGYSLVRFLLAHGGKRKFVEYVGDGMSRRNWTEATREHYGFKNLSELQTEWLDWVRRRCPPIAPGAPLVAAAISGNEESAHAATGQPSPRNSGETSQEKSTQLVSTGGWYARTRDAARVANDADSTFPTSAAPRHGDTAETMDSQSVTRPQGRNLPRQIVVEQAALPGRPAPGRAILAPARQPNGYLISGDILTRTLWR